MKLKVSSGDYCQVVEFRVENRRVAHRLGCLYALASGKRLGCVIRTSTHLDSNKVHDDGLWSSTEALEQLLGEVTRDQEV